MCRQMILVDNFTDISLGGNDTHVWFGRAVSKQDNIKVKNRLRYMDSEESRRYDRYKFPQKQHEFLIGRIFLKKILAQYLDISPWDITLKYSTNGKPILSSETGSINLQFNLSHSHSGFACAIALKEPVGIDMEYIRPVEQDYINPYLTPEEIKYLSELSSSERLKSLFRIWTLKEAFLKAKDLPEEISSTDFFFSFEDSDIKIHTREIDFPDNWKFYSMIPTDNFSLSLAVRSDHPVKFEVKYHCLNFDFY